jgi:hypothetical protein
MANAGSVVPGLHSLIMELALILISIASFFALILAWTMLPASKEVAQSTPAPAATTPAAV